MSKLDLSDDDLFENETPRASATGSRNGSGVNSRHPSSNNPFFNPQIPPIPMYEYNHGHGYQSSSAYSTVVDDHDWMEKVEALPKRSKTVAFRESVPEFPAHAYSPRKHGPYDMERVETYELEGPQQYMRPYSSVLAYTGDDYGINPLQDADDDDDMDPFGDDESLFSDTGEEFVRRGTTTKRSGTRKKSMDAGEFDEDDFTPRLNYTKTIKRAKLVNGNYVIDAPVPKALLDTHGKKISEEGDEMSFMRYTAATCGPSNFGAFNYNLRQALYTPKRETEIMVCVTMYNENEILLARTLKGIFENITNLTKRSDPCWGDDSWKKVVICIVNDGRKELNPRSQKFLAALGVYQDGYAKSKINEKAVKSHIYEYTTPVGIDMVTDRVYLTSNSTPVQLLFCLKEKNAKKINSHRWCFQSFAPILNPKVIMLLDCGTRPAKDAFYYLWRAFRDPNVAGACGEMKAALGKGRRLLQNPLVAAQNFEYKISNILDKPMESVFGFISVLPGAFSAYRWEALLNVDGKGPLEKYFKGEFLHQDSQIEDDDDDEKLLKEKNYQEAGIFTSNMYLAEDRILCFELVAKRNHNYILRYVEEAKAETDVPERIDEFVLQRRRWLNGSLFAAGYAVVHWTKIWRSNHSLLRKLFLQLEFYYQLVTLLVSWFSLASFFLVFRILTANLGAKEMNFGIGKYLSVIFLWLYVGSVVCTFVLAFGNTPRGTKKFYSVIAVLFAIMMLYMLFAAVFLAVHTVTSVLKAHKDDFKPMMLFTNSKFRDLIVSTGSTYALYFIASLLYGAPSFMVTSFGQYLLLSPTYVNVLNIYAFSNIDDVSWGTKGAPEAKNLGTARSTGANKDDIVMVVPGVEEELNESYMQTLESLRTVPPPEAKIKKGKDDSYYAFIRTMTVLVWMITNAILIAIVLEVGGVSIFDSNSKQNADGSVGGNSQIFLTIILWIVAGLAAYRFIGSVLYLLLKTARPLKWRIKARKQLKNATR